MKTKNDYLIINKQNSFINYFKRQLEFSLSTNSSFIKVNLSNSKFNTNQIQFWFNSAFDQYINSQILIENHLLFKSSFMHFQQSLQNQDYFYCSINLKLKSDHNVRILILKYQLIQVLSLAIL